MPCPTEQGVCEQSIQSGRDESDKADLMKSVTIFHCESDGFRVVEMREGCKGFRVAEMQGV